MQPKLKGAPTNREYLLLFLFFLFSYYLFSCFALVRVSGVSMRPTLGDGETYLAAKLDLWDALKNGDIVCAETDDGMVVKRILGIPGDSIEITPNGQILRNGYPIGWINYRPMRVKLIKYYFLCGDNREVSETYFLPRRSIGLRILWQN